MTKSPAARHTRRCTLRLMTGVGGASSLAIPKRDGTVLLRHSEPCMGTMFTVQAFHQDEPAGYAAIQAAFKRMHVLDTILSDYRPGNELSRLCTLAHRQPFEASAELFHVIETGLALARSTGGAFDITIGPLSRLWRLARRTGQLPTAKAVQEARARTGWRGITLDSSRRTVRLRREGMRLDFGGIAKGFAADKALEELGRHGVLAALVAVGGDVAVSAEQPGQPRWEVTLYTGREDRQVPIRLVRQAVSTSGDLNQFLEIDGVRYSHIVDPETGLGLTQPIAVSVVTPTAMQSDSTATALSVMGLSRAQEWLAEQPKIEARIVSGADGGGHVWQTAGFPVVSGNPA